MATPLLKSWTPNTSYEFDLRINDQDYSNDLVSISIRSAVNTPYQNISLNLYLDGTDMITEEIYGQTPIKLSIRLKGEVTWPQEDIEFDLLFLNTANDYTTQRTIAASDQSERVPITFETIVRPAYQSMTTLVNGIYYGKTPEAIITDVLSNTNATVEYDTNAKNPLAIDQFLIPPSTVYRTIKYLDRTYGIFNGILGFNCTYDNKIKVQNLSKKTTSSQGISVRQFATNTDQSKLIDASDPRQFYTKVPVKAFNRGNSVFSVLAPTNRFIVKPRNELYKTIDINTETLATSYGIIAPNISNTTEIFYDKDGIKTDKRISYHTNQTGYDSDTGFINAGLSRSIQDMSQLTIEVQHNLPILNLMAVGEGVTFLTDISEYQGLSGVYVLKASEIGWIRSKMWESWARLYLMRTNISVT